MPLSYYIATGLEHAPKAKELKTILDAKGWNHTYDWTVHGSVQRDPARIATVSVNEMLGVDAADVVIVLLPGGRGTHVELGAAVISALYRQASVFSGGQKSIVVYSENPADDFGFGDKTCAFYHHPKVGRVATWSTLLTWIDTIDTEARS